VVAAARHGIVELRLSQLLAGRLQFGQSRLTLEHAIYRMQGGFREPFSPHTI
jgi:hypothetical protein